MDERSEPGTDTGLMALVLLLRFLGVAADPLQIRHRTAGVALDPPAMVRAARELGFKARTIQSRLDRLPGTPLPAITRGIDGRYFILGRVADGRALIQEPWREAPRVIALTDLATLWDGTLVLLARRARIGDLARRFDVGWFLQAMGKYRGVLTEVLVASFFLQVFALVTPLFFQVVTDKVLVHRGITTLQVLVVGLIAVSAFECVLGALRTYIFSHTTNRIDVELGARLFRHLTALPLAYFEARRVGDSVARVRELENIRNFLTGSALTLVLDLLFTFVFLAVMFYYSPFLAWVVIASLPLYVLLSATVTPIFRRRLDERFARGAENQAFLVEGITGIETLKAMAVEPQMQQRWEEQLAGYVRSSFRVQSLGNWASQLVQFISKVVTALVLFFGAEQVIAGNMTVGELIAFNMLATRVAQPVLRLAQLWQDFQQARISIDRLGDILNTRPEALYNPARTTPPVVNGNIVFENASFRYRPDGAEVLNRVNLAIPAGQVLGIVGPSGSGKSTLAKLVQRLYVPESGRVLIDGIDIALIDVSWLRRQIGMVLQENVLFNRSIRDNIALADPGMAQDRVVDAAELAGAHDFILELPEGYDTLVGERGQSLSGGQRQRIAIARALVTDPRILIFDEATSALDYESENIIQQNLRRICAGRTVLLIAHRLSTLRQADRIITLERGRIIEDGTHEALMRAGGRYAALHRAQLGHPGESGLRLAE
jgi:ATP-binding cassette, subfamily B, bacterial HlyB/CyaB